MAVEEEAAEVRAEEEAERKERERKEAGAEKKERVDKERVEAGGEGKAVVPAQVGGDEMPKLVSTQPQPVRRRKPRRVKGPILLYVFSLLSPTLPSLRP